MGHPTTRLAPSPTGALHLGNARTFLVNWAIARQTDQRVVLRIEDLDGPRIKPGADTLAITDLQWLGIDWDGQPLYQRHDLSPYTQAMDQLAQQGLIYPCICTRSDVRAAQSAPQKDAHELRYPGTCRPTGKTPADGRASTPNTPTHRANTPSAWRVIVPDEPIEFTDQLHGPQRINVQQQTGDFIVATKSNLPAYQLAVVVDDARQGVTHIVRGDDLLRSAARQLLLYRLLELHPLPQYLHLPLVLGPDGRRLAKRHGDTRLAWYRDQKVAPERIVGLIARWCGITDRNTPMNSQMFLERFALDRMLTLKSPMTFTIEDHTWLLEN